jgi:hypothetical protein
MELSAEKLLVGVLILIPVAFILAYFASQAVHDAIESGAMKELRQAVSEVKKAIHDALTK